MSNVSKEEEGLKPLIKWPGGKERELKFIIPNAPKKFENYYEPFVGGASVYMAFSGKNFFINDKSTELTNLYKYISTKDEEFYKWANGIELAWKKVLNYSINSGLETVFIRYRNNEIDDKGLTSEIKEFLEKNKSDLIENLPSIFTFETGIFYSEINLNLVRKLKRMKKLEQEKWLLPDSDVSENIQTAFMSALYMYFRHLYNSKEIQKNIPLYTALFLFIRNYSYSGMFRYNDDGEFNVPYGGMGYNSKSLKSKLDYYQSDEVIEKMNKTKIENLDFQDFFNQNQPTENDFVFLDPPYDSEFSTYANNDFTKTDQKRLADYLCEECRGKWMMIIKATPYILSLYENRGLNIKTFDKTYTVSFMNRNDKKAEHLIIMNY